jgi:hypothetical protein
VKRGFVKLPLKLSGDLMKLPFVAKQWCRLLQFPQNPNRFLDKASGQAGRMNSPKNESGHPRRFAPEYRAEIAR